MSGGAEPNKANEHSQESWQRRCGQPAWWWLALIVCVVVSALVGVQIWGLGSSKPSWDIVVIIALANAALYLWIRLATHWPIRRQVAAVLTLVVVQALLYGMMRIEGFAGDGRLIVTWRWEPTQEQRWAEFATHTVQLAGVADLTQIQSGDSPGFRGADRAGHFICQELNSHWNDHPPHLLWRHPVGAGWSSFAVVGSYCVTQEQRGERECVVCYDVATGQEVWEYGAVAKFDEVTSGPGPRATPTIHQGRVYAAGATGLIHCLDGANGKVVWQRSLADIAPGVAPPLFGYAGSPLVQAGKVVVSGGAAGALIAFSADDGTLLWRASPRASGYSSPQLWQNSDGNQIVLLDGVGLHGHDVETGRVLWSVDWGDGSDEYVNVGQPVLLQPSSGIDALDILISSGYGRGIASFGVSRGSNDGWEVRERWRSKSLESKFSCVVVRDQHAYGLDKGILTCVSLADGKRCWKKGRYGYGQLIALNDLLLVQAEDGRVVLVQADPTSATELAAIPALSDRTWNHPVVAQGRLFVRNDREAACYELPKSAAESEATAAER